jgi:hypothetical protein
MTRLVKIGGKKSWKAFQILQNVIEKSFIIWQALLLVKIKTRICRSRLF